MNTTPNIMNTKQNKERNALRSSRHCNIESKQPLEKFTLFKLALLNKMKLPLMALLAVLLIVGCKKDEEPGLQPIVTFTNPINKSLNIAPNSQISVGFNQEMNVSTLTASTFTLQQGTSMVAGEIEYTDKTVTFIPAADLASNTLYTATITTGVKDNGGKALAKNYIWSFTTGATADVVLPTVSMD